MSMDQAAPKKKFPAAAIVAIVLAVLVAVLAGVYCGLCKWVQGNGRLLPGTVAADSADTAQEGLDLGGLTADEALPLLEQDLDGQLRQRELTIRYGENMSAVLDGSLLKVDPAAMVEYGMAVKNSRPFLTLGAQWLGIAGDPIILPLSAATLTDEGETAAHRLVQLIAEDLYVAPVDFTYELTDETVELTLGFDGEMVDEDALFQQIQAALISGQTELDVTTVPAPTAELDGQILSWLVYVEPQAPSLDENGKITPAVVGISIDPDEAQAILEDAQPGQSCSIPITRTVPDLTGAEDFLYQDLLASCVTNLDGVANRSFNVNRTAEFCNGTILMPGEVFSYLNTIGDPSTANGYKLSTGYKDGLTVEMEGGGACQVSSSLYYCAVYANLEIVSRASHAFSVGYVPNGLDATVYYPSLDFRFRNNTEYPIKLVAYTTGNAWGKVTVQIYGTKTDDTYVVPEVNTLSSTPWQTIYKPDETIPAGTTKVDVTPYTGYLVETYRCVYSGDGTLLSRTFENKSSYAKRDKVILFNPADAASLGLYPDGTPLPEGSTPSQGVGPSDDPLPTTEPTPEPTTEPTPEPTESAPANDPAVSESPEPTTAPAADPSPEPTPGQGEADA